MNILISPNLNFCAAYLFQQPVDAVECRRGENETAMQHRYVMRVTAETKTGAQRPNNHAWNSSLNQTQRQNPHEFILLSR